MALPVTMDILIVIWRSEKFVAVEPLRLDIIFKCKTSVYLW